MDRFPPLAWVAIAIIVVVGAVVNIWMVTLLRSKDQRNQSAISNRPPRGLSQESMQKLVRVLRNPFGDEQNKLDQLSKMIQSLKDKKE